MHLDVALALIICSHVERVYPIVASVTVTHLALVSMLLCFALLCCAYIPLLCCVLCCVQVRVLLTRILEEKERKIKIALRMNGLSPIIDLAAWTITTLAKNSIVVTVVTAVACGVGIFKYAAFSVVWVFFMLMMLSCIAFCFAAATLFSKSRTGGALGMLIYLLLSAPTYALTLPGVPDALKIGLGLLAPCAFSLGTSIIVLAEQRHAGVTWVSITEGSGGGRVRFESHCGVG